MCKIKYINKSRPTGGASKDFEITMINMYKKIDGKMYKIDEKNWEFFQRIIICKNEKV